jgi:post-segregation antitoxin (ccd killing protein)
MTTKRNVVLYLDKDLVEKSKALGFNLSKTFESVNIATLKSTFIRDAENINSV